MFDKLKTFIMVVNEAGFAKAAKRLNLSKSTVTRYIKELEDEYQATLLMRTTRHISLTEQGKKFFHYAVELLQTNEQCLVDIQQAKTVIAGNIKLGVPASIADYFCDDIFPKLIKKYPELTINVIIGDHLQDLLSNNFDLVIHCGELSNISYYFKKVTMWRKIVCASPTYLKKNGMPLLPHDLRNHNCINHSNKHTNAWLFNYDKKLLELPVQGNIRINDSKMIKKLALNDLGIVQLPDFVVFKELSKKILVPILEKYWTPPLPQFILYPHRRENNIKVKTMIEAFSIELALYTSHGRTLPEFNS